MWSHLWGWALCKSVKSFKRGLHWQHHVHSGSTNILGGEGRAHLHSVADTRNTWMGPIIIEVDHTTFPMLKVVAGSSRAMAIVILWLDIKAPNTVLFWKCDRYNAPKWFIDGFDQSNGGYSSGNDQIGIGGNLGGDGELSVTGWVYHRWAPYRKCAWINHEGHTSRQNWSYTPSHENPLLGSIRAVSQDNHVELGNWKI